MHNPIHLTKRSWKHYLAENWSTAREALPKHHEDGPPRIIDKNQARYRWSWPEKPIAHSFIVGGFWCWILNAVRCIIRMLFYSIDWVIKFRRSWKKKKIDVYTDRMNEVEKCSLYFVSWEVLYLSCTACKIISVRYNTCLMEIMDYFLIMIINAALNLTDAY